MEQRVVRRKNGDDFNESYVQRLAEEYKKSKEAQALIEKRTNDLKKELSDVVDTFGVADDGGHLWVEVGDFKMKREKRVSRNLDLDKVEKWAKENGHWDAIKEVIEVVSEDKMLALAWANEDVATALEDMYTVKEIWAFKL